MELSQENTALQRLKLTILYLKKCRTIISQAEFASMIGIKASQMSEILNGKRKLSEQVINKIIKTFTQINPNWLLTGKGEMVNSSPEENTKNENNNNNLNIVPLLPVSARGGSLGDFVSSVKPEDCEKIISPINGVDFAMPVYGDSMEPEYPSGSTVLIKKINERAFIVWGQTYVLDTCNGSVIKRILPGPDENSVTCVSLNSEYPPFVVRFEDMFGMYRVLMVLSFK